jgi:hypothetical protein
MSVKRLKGAMFELDEKESERDMGERVRGSRWRDKKRRHDLFVKTPF